MLVNTSEAKSLKNFHCRLLIILLLLANTAGIVVYAVTHFLLFDTWFEGFSELIVMAKILAITSAFALSISALFVATDLVALILIKRKLANIRIRFKAASIALIATIILLAACSAPVRVGIKKDFNTGLSSSYNGMEPEQVLLVMNNEVLNHADIPLGESFLIVNDGIKGLQAKNGKVKVGCSLSIADQQGNLLLNEKDLFEGRDEFEEKDAKLLKCTVNTGDPMKWEEKYDITVTFWDKNGKGSVENKVTIRSIDMP